MEAVLDQQLERDGVTFPVAYCLTCHKEVMVFGALGDGARANALLWRCIFCNEEVLQEDSGVHYEKVQDLRELGYRIVEPDALESVKGCGSGGGCHH